MLDLLKQRRSTRKFQNTSVEEDKVTLLIKSALLSPSSRGINPWEFIVVDDKEIITELSRAKEHGSSFLKGAPLAIVVLGDPDKSDVWVEDASIASVIIQLTAESLGLGSCWIQIRNRKHDKNRSSEQFVQELLNIPSDIKVESIIAIGYKAEHNEPYADGTLLHNKVYKNNYGKPLYY